MDKIDSLSNIVKIQGQMLQNARIPRFHYIHHATFMHHAEILLAIIFICCLALVIIGLILCRTWRLVKKDVYENKLNLANMEWTQKIQWDETNKQNAIDRENRNKETEEERLKREYILKLAGIIKTKTTIETKEEEPIKEEKVKKSSVKTETNETIDENMLTRLLNL